MSVAPNLEIYIEINWLIIEFGETFHNTKWKTEISKSLSVFYLVPKHFCCPNWVKSNEDDAVLGDVDLSKWQHFLAKPSLLIWRKFL